jgi:hypothetical protein
MKTVRIYYHDGTVQVIRPQTDNTKENLFKGDVGGLVSTVARRLMPTQDPTKNPNGKLWVRIETD